MARRANWHWKIAKSVRTVIADNERWLGERQHSRQYEAQATSDVSIFHFSGAQSPSSDSGLQDLDTA